MLPQVSWLIAVKNGLPFLTEALASIEAQTFRDFEVLIWDNGSSDGTVEEARRWIPSRLPGRIVADRPLGLSASRAQLVLLSQAEFCAVLDADDIAEPRRLELQIAFLKENPGIGLVGSQLAFADADGRLTGNASNYPLQHEDIVLSTLFGNPIGQPAILFRRKDLLDAGNYACLPEEDWGRNGCLNGVEDFELWLRLATKTKLANLDEKLTRYRLHARSITREAIRLDLLETKMARVFGQHAHGLFDWGRTNGRALLSARTQSPHRSSA